MSREQDLKRLKKSLHETQDILNHLITETSSELEKKWDVSQKDAGKRLAEAGKRFEKTYDQARSRLDSTLKGTSKDLEKRYKGTTKDLEKRYSTSKKEAEKAYDKTRHSANQNFKDLNAEANKRFSEVKKTANERTQDLRLKTADWLQGLAAGVLSFRNKLNPKTRYAIRDEKQKHHLGKGGYFKRFIALAIIIVSKKDQLLSLGSQLYNKLQDQESRDALKDDALGQYDTMRRLIKAYANGEYREFPYMSIVKIVAAVVYFVSVVDLIPDFIPIIGLTDDLAVLAWVYMSVKDDLQKFVDWESANERRQEKMENQRANAGNSNTSPSSPVADREASPNTGTSRTSTTPSATAAIGASSSVINNRATEASRQNNDTNTGGSAGNTAGSAGGSASKSAGTSGSSASGNTNSGSTSGGGGNSGGSSSANQGNTNQKSGGSSPSSGRNSGR